MAYKYITENNLDETQNYMYSEYGGMDFIKEYLDSRQGCIECREERECLQDRREKNNTVREELKEILEKLKSSKCDEEAIHSVDVYTKRFEVRKRIYTKYASNKKPHPDAGFNDYKSYLLLAACLLIVYRKKKCLKYFSCLLKVDDTLLSVKDNLGKEENEYLRQIIRQELDIFYQLAEENGIRKEALE